YIGGMSGVDIDGKRAGFIVPVGAPGVTILCRKPATRETNPFIAPLSLRYDELDGQMWLDDVFVPSERVFFVGPNPDPIARWLRWHHLYGWLAKAEFSLGLALALADAMALKEHEPTVEYLVDLVVEVQTVRSCIAAAELEESFGGGGWTALQRSALLQLAWDHVSSALDGRESAFELHASGGMPNWRGWLRQNFRDYNRLASAVLRSMDIEMPEIDVS